MNKYMKPNKLSLIGFLQALGLVAYCSLVASLIWGLGRTFDSSPGISGIIFSLFLLAFSVAVCGSIVFGYPVYLVVNKNIKDALNVLLYTLLYCLGLLAAVLVISFSLTEV